MDASDPVDVVTSGLIIAEQSHQEDAETRLLSLNHTSTVVASSPITEQPLHSNSATALFLPENVNVDSGNENQSQILKANSDSDESNESGSLPSKSSSTSGSSGGMGKDDRVTIRSGTRLKSSKRKKDRSKLRKGKWTVSNYSG